MITSQSKIKLININNSVTITSTIRLYMLQKHSKTYPTKIQNLMYLLRWQCDNKASKNYKIIKHVTVIFWTHEWQTCNVFSELCDTSAVLSIATRSPWPMTPEWNSSGKLPARRSDWFSDNIDECCLSSLQKAVSPLSMPLAFPPNSGANS